MTDDEAAALQVMAAELLRTLRACSVGDPIGAAGPRRRQRRPSVAGGRGARARACSTAARRISRDGATPEAVEPVRAASAIVGTLALRWVTGATPPSAARARRAAGDGRRRRRRCCGRCRRARREPQPTRRFPTTCSARARRPARCARRSGAPRVAPYPVLIEGESGSGKELVARAIHARGLRRARAASAPSTARRSPSDLLEAELFGHARGAFTGAAAERPGSSRRPIRGRCSSTKSASCRRGRRPSCCACCRKGRCAGSARTSPARSTSASSRRPTVRSSTRSQAGAFRADLRFRLDVIRIAIPPLRERARRRAVAASSGSGARPRPASARRAIARRRRDRGAARYDWPGNVRELQNVIAALAVHGPRRGRVPRRCCRHASRTRARGARSGSTRRGSSSSAASSARRWPAPAAAAVSRRRSSASAVRG